VQSFFRRVWRWHFWAGLVSAPVLIVVALTGAVYTFKDEIEDCQQADSRFFEPVGEQKPLSEQIAAVKAAHPDWKPTRVTLPANPRKSTLVQVERPDAEKGTLSAVFVNPYSAGVIAEGDVRSPFFSGVLKLHRSLFAGTFGRVVVELTTSWTLVLLVSGLFLWWPGRWNRVWGVWLPRLRSRPYVVLRDLHTVGGLFLTPVIALIAFTGLFFTVVWLWSFNGLSNGAGSFPRRLTTAPPSQAPSTGASPVSIDVAVAAAQERFPHQTLVITLPKNPIDAFAFTARNGRGQAVDGSVAVDQYTGAVLSDKRAEHLSAVEQARLYVLPIHMGTIGGTTTKVLAMVACLVLAGLGVSGVWMWLARRPAGRTGFPQANDARIPRPAVIVILLLAITLPTVGLSLIVVLAGEWLYGRLRHPSLNQSSTETKVEVSVLSSSNEVSK
jgi:uncharacterized iron-regulated membrane protein